MSKSEKLCQIVPLAAGLLAIWGCLGGHETLGPDRPTEAPPSPVIVPISQQAVVPAPACEWGSSYRRPDGALMPTEALRVEPELVAAGVFWSLTLGDHRVFTISSHRNNGVVPDRAEVLSFDLSSLARQVVFSSADGLQDPAVLLMHEGTLYLEDWGSGSLLQVPAGATEFEVLATGFVGGLGLSRWKDSVFLSDYRGGSVFRVRDPSAATAAFADGPLDVEAVVVEELSKVPHPGEIAAWPEHAAWTTNGHDAHLDNQLVIRDLVRGTDVSIEVPGIVAGIGVSDAELAWTSYGPMGSEFSGTPLGQSGAPVRGQIDTVMFCGQPSAAVLSGTLAVYGGPGLMLWERDAAVLHVLQAAGFVRYIAVNEAHIYFANWDGLYRIPRP